ncbi:MAG: hypothetical protein HQL66_10690 [Magnetococcales bacterium]|nr:hypothetical protein [Magnetococcales bacterium]
MPVLIIAGLPRSLAERAKAVWRDFRSEYRLPADWELDSVDTHKKSPTTLPAADVLRVCQRVFESTKSHIVVIGVRARESDNQRQSEQYILPFFRFRWFDNKFLHMIYESDPALVTVLSEIIQEEACWCQEVKPRNCHHPLLLPKDIFSSQRECQGLWKACEAYGDINNIDGAVKSIELFKRTHDDKEHSWIDSKKRFFDPNGALHGKAPNQYQWKYSFRLPDGFHYDISHESQQAFRMTDADGKEHTVLQGGHLNLDPHGRVR